MYTVHQAGQTEKNHTPEGSMPTETITLIKTSIKTKFTTRIRTSTLESTKTMIDIDSIVILKERLICVIERREEGRKRWIK